jgi:hypothetical protein
MGIVTIKIEGSFGEPDEKTFSAQEGGHAYALTRAIGFLFARMSPAIRKDHELHEAGEHPDSSPFGHKP